MQNSPVHKFTYTLNDGSEVSFIEKTSSEADAKFYAKYTDADYTMLSVEENYQGDEVVENTDLVKLVVYNEHTLGYIQPELPNYVAILRGSILRGALLSWKHGYASIGFSDTVRLATPNDFDDYMICFKGFDNPQKYLYQPVS